LKELLFSDGFGFAIKFYQKLGFFSIFFVLTQWVKLKNR